MQLGKRGKGIIGSGQATSVPFYGPHWDAEKRKARKKSLLIECKWDRLLNSYADEILSFKKLNNGKLGNFDWTPQASGVQIDAEIAAKLEQVWTKYVGKPIVVSLPLDEELAALEGEQRLALIRHRKREQRLRTAKFEQVRKKNNGRLYCSVPGCGFDFEKVYGVLGKDYAHVHHLKPLGDRESPSKTLLVDLAVVCPNCHAMIHRGGKCRELKELIS